MTDKTILAIDNGTQSVRAILFDLQGNIIAKSQVHFESYFSEHPGWAEHDPEDYWQSLCRACNQLWEQPGADKAAVQGVAVTTQRGTVINVGQDGKALRPAITWLDQRRTDAAPHVGMWWNAAFRLARVKGTIDYFRGEAEINWIKAHQPDIWDRTHKVLLLSGYLNYRLCGRYVDSTGSQVAYLPFRLQAPALGRAARLEVAGARDHPANAARAGGAGQRDRPDLATRWPR